MLTVGRREFRRNADGDMVLVKERIQTDADPVKPVKLANAKPDKLAKAEPMIDASSSEVRGDSFFKAKPASQVELEENPSIKIGSFTLTDASFKSYIPLETPRKNPKTGKMESTQIIFHHHVLIRRDSWPESTHLKVSRHRQTYSITFPDGSRDKSQTVTAMGQSLKSRFDETTAMMILSMLA